jgi:hypothetical protein
MRIKDARENHYYYNCDPFAFCSTTNVNDINESISIRDSQENNFLLWLATEFFKLGDFEFIKIREDNSMLGTRYFETQLKRCKQQRITYMDFCWSLASWEKGLENDVLYSVYSGGVRK